MKKKPPWLNFTLQVNISSYNLGIGLIEQYKFWMKRQRIERLRFKFAANHTGMKSSKI